MNFEFLKDLKLLNILYDECENAEKLAVTMPKQSMFTARTCAETLARWLYIASHKEEMGGMTFADILKDPTVCRFVNDRQVMSAFHHIKQNGNRAAHCISPESKEDAISVLNDLHFVAGETARKLKLIDSYPEFNQDIKEDLNATYAGDKVVEARAQEMFNAFIAKYSEQIAEDGYYEGHIQKLQRDFSDLRSPSHLVSSEVQVVEILEFKAAPISKSILSRVQDHFGHLGIRAINALQNGQPDDEYKIDYSVELTIYGKDGYITSNLEEFVHGVLYDLSSSDGFKIVSDYHGPSIDPWFDSDVRASFEAVIYDVGDKDSFTYSCFEFLFNHGAGSVRKFENGQWIDLTKLFSDQILDTEYDDTWWCWNLDLWVDFDFEKYPDIINALHDIVRRRIPKEELEYCEVAWSEEEDRPGTLCDSIGWYPIKLRTVQDFLDEINKTIEPILDECTGGCEGKWYITCAPLAIAYWQWTKDGFKITGTEL